MKYDLDALEKKLNSISEESRIIDEELKKKSELNHYQLMNQKYKKYISQYSKSYIEMSEHYYGPELPYEVYCNEFHKGTYLDSKKDVKELYSLFLFFGLFQLYTGVKTSNTN